MASFPAPLLRRRDFLASGAAAGALALAPGFLRDALAAPARAGAGPYGELLPPNADELMLPPGFSSRQIARGLSPVRGYGFPVAPDGQATFATRDGGWILVTNAESFSPIGAGVSAIRFRSDGAILSAQRILGGTDLNCAGGATPWGTWLSCEEADDGMVWECDPAGVLRAEPRPALGLFAHEAAAVDPIGMRVYLTEDEGEGLFYRFTPASYPDLRTGLLEAAVVAADGAVSWRPVPDPSAGRGPTRGQVAEAARFDGGEGIWYHRGTCYWTTKGDKKVWAYDIPAERLEVLFDREQAQDSALNAVDNVTVTSGGDVFVCEDGGNMEVGLITPDRIVSPFLRFAGVNHSRSEVCGVCFDPSGTRMYVTSQGAYPVIPPAVSGPAGIPAPANRGPGAVYEITGPFRIPRGGVPADEVFGPPAGELRPSGPLAADPGDSFAPRAEVQVPRRIARGRFAAAGVAVRVELEEPGEVTARLFTRALGTPRPGRGGSAPRPRSTTLARARRRAPREVPLTLHLRPGRAGRASVRAYDGAFHATLVLRVIDDAGNDRTITRRIRIGA